METYRRDRTYLWNYQRGPRWSAPLPSVPRGEPRADLFGHPVGARLGVAAGLLLNSRWIGLYARLGFDILTYKTVRSAARPCYPLPNWVCVDAGDGVDPERDAILRRAPRRPRRAADITSAVCFGMPSMDPSVWAEDIVRARQELRRGQVLVVSVVGTPRDDGGEEALADDYALCASRAAASGAHVVEANFSCPNVCSAEGSIYQDPGASARIASRLREVLPSTPLVVKAGHFASAAAIEEFCRAVAPSVDGVLLVNGVARRVVGGDGRPVFGRYERVGILGRGIREPAVASVRAATRAVRRSGLDLTVLAVGGVTSEEDPARHFDAGAAAVLLGGAPMFDPLLAARMRSLHPEW